MLKLPSQKKILREDIKEAPTWINGIVEPLNSFMETTYQALNKNITLTENIASFIKEITYRTNSTYPMGMGKIYIQNGLKSRAIGIMVMQVYEKSTYIPAPGPVYIPWVEENASIAISTITGLEADKTYTIRLVVF